MNILFDKSALDLLLEKLPKAISHFERDVAVRAGRATFFEQGGYLYASLQSGSSYTYSAEDAEWFDS